VGRKTKDQCDQDKKVELRRRDILFALIACGALVVIAMVAFGGCV
jgi:hypothetical protein